MRKSLSFHSSVRYFKYIVLVLLFYPLTVLGAQGHITVKGQSITIKEAIMLIEKNSNYVFFYNAADLKNIRLKNINCSGPIDKVLNEVFANTGITYLIQGNDVVLKVSKTESAQQAKKTEIVGVVTDARTGEAVIGASVAIVGTTTGVITDIDGKFVIQAGPQDVLKISYVGYTAKEVKVGNRKVLAIDLSEDAQALEEVVVTAYGTGQKKASMVGSVQAIRPAELKVPSTNLSNSFAGRLSGVVAVQRTGRPGADGSDFWIRGISTLSEATSPLIIIDGVQVSSADLNALDPEVIDGFSILKDATATAMYGTRGANGVMIVTTKSGQNLDKPIINFRVEGQISQPTKTPKFVDGATYMELFNEAVKNDGSPDVLYSQDKINGTRMKLNPYVFPDVNWYDEMFNDVAFNEKVNFNIRGGGKKIDYFSSISVNHESGMLKNRSKDFFSYNNNIDVMRYAFQNNINAYLSKSSKLSVRLNVQLRDLREPNRGIDDIFADAMDPEGYILHFIGHYYVGMGTVGGRVPTEKGWMLDNASGWIIQLVKDYEQTGDTEYLKAHLTGLKRAMKFLYSRMPQGSTIPVGPTTYDDFTHPPLYSYYAGVWLTTLKAYEAIGKAIGDESIVKQAQQQFATSQKEALEKLWNGRFFAYGCEPDGSKRLDNVLFTGQLAGQFLSRYCGWGDVYPMDIVKASMISQCKISLSKSPDYYANKVWDINLNRGIDNRGSQCWPFYLESYTALAGMQAGFYEDAMDIMKHIQLVHLRKGWTWTQNLWNPSDITYMTAPVTWFSTDVLAGAGVNIPRKELRLAPVVTDDKVISIPLFYPNFWGVVTADPQKKSITFKITKKYGKERISFNKVISEPAGLSTSEKREIEIKEFVVEEGKTLDLSPYWDRIIDNRLEAPVLQEADKHDFRYVTIK